MSSAANSSVRRSPRQSRGASSNARQEPGSRSRPKVRRESNRNRESKRREESPGETPRKFAYGKWPDGTCYVVPVPLDHPDEVKQGHPVRQGSGPSRSTLASQNLPVDGRDPNLVDQKKEADFMAGVWQLNENATRHLYHSRGIPIQLMSQNPRAAATTHISTDSVPNMGTGGMHEACKTYRPFDPNPICSNEDFAKMLGPDVSPLGLALLGCDGFA